jgi:hypothetical protein
MKEKKREGTRCSPDGNQEEPTTCGSEAVKSAVSGKRSQAPDLTSNEVALSASEGDDGESGHLALQRIEGSVG